jgi:hypothetical protein
LFRISGFENKKNLATLVWITLSNCALGRDTQQLSGTAHTRHFSILRHLFFEMIAKKWLANGDVPRSGKASSDNGSFSAEPE